jgi:hypothetical protein
MDHGTSQQQKVSNLLYPYIWPTSWFQDAEKALADQTEVLHEWLKANDLPTVLSGLKSHLLST